MRSQNFRRAELLTAILLSLMVVFLLVLRATHAGPPWRDECGVVQLARMPTFAETLANFTHQSYPPLFPALVRLYTAVAGTSVAALRSFGFVVALGVIGVAWFNSRRVGDGRPLVFLSLLGLNPTFLTSGPSMRAYGLGCLLLLLTLGLAAKALREPTKRNLWGLLIAAIASIHIHLNNVPLIGAIILSAGLVLIMRRRFKQAAIISILASITALSFFPVWPSYAAADWSRVVGYPVSLMLLAQKCTAALGEPLWLMTTVWAAVVLVAIVLMAWRLRGRWYIQPTAETDLLAFLVIFSVLSIIAYCAMLKILRYPTSPWYYLPPICALAGAIDLMVAIQSHKAWVRSARLICAATALVFLPFAAWHPVLERDTNMDIVARQLEKNAGAGDLIVVNPWFLGVSFNWYYHGYARWVTIPIISEHRVHRYDLIKAKMMELEPLADLLNEIRRVLKSEHRIWIVGGARPPEPGLPLALHPAPDPQFGWVSQAYVNVWSMQLAEFLQTHVISGTVMIPPASDMSEIENVPLLVAQGWRD